MLSNAKKKRASVTLSPTAPEYQFQRLFELPQSYKVRAIILKIRASFTSTAPALAIENLTQLRALYDALISQISLHAVRMGGYVIDPMPLSDLLTQIAFVTGGDGIECNAPDPGEIAAPGAFDLTAIVKIPLGFDRRLYLRDTTAPQVWQLEAGDGLRLQFGGGVAVLGGGTWTAPFMAVDVLLEGDAMDGYYMVPPIHYGIYQTAEYEAPLPRGAYLFAGETRRSAESVGASAGITIQRDRRDYFLGVDFDPIAEAMDAPRSYMDRTWIDRILNTGETLATYAPLIVHNVGEAARPRDLITVQSELRLKMDPNTYTAPFRFSFVRVRPRAEGVLAGGLAETGEIVSVGMGVDGGDLPAGYDQYQAARVTGRV